MGAGPWTRSVKLAKGTVLTVPAGSRRKSSFRWSTQSDADSLDRRVLDEIDTLAWAR